MKGIKELKNKDVKWLRCATLDHVGHLPGMAWETAPAAFQRLMAKGLIERRPFKSLRRDEMYYRAVITAAGNAALLAWGEMMNAYAAEIRASAPSLTTGGHDGHPSS